jgi:hypothetical protein
MSYEKIRESFVETRQVPEDPGTTEGMVLRLSRLLRSSPNELNLFQHGRYCSTNRADAASSSSRFGPNLFGQNALC